MNRTIGQIAREFISGTPVHEGLLNRVEAGIRAFDPCLSCSTHAMGAMPMRLQVVDAAGHVVQTLLRDGT